MTFDIPNLYPLNQTLYIEAIKLFDWVYLYLIKFNILYSGN
jgi:hypothetical protein